MIGPAIAAGLIAFVGLGPCFILNGISYAAVVIMLTMMNANELNLTSGAKIQGADFGGRQICAFHAALAGHAAYDGSGRHIYF